MIKYINKAAAVVVALAGQITRRFHGDKFFRVSTRAKVDPAVLATKFPTQAERDKQHARAGVSVNNGKFVRRGGAKAKRGIKR